MIENTLPVEKNEQTETGVPQCISSGFIENFKDCYKIGGVYAKSTLVPSNYKNNPGDCAIAVNMAERMGIDPIMVMQSLYVVKGKPSWSGQACMSFIRAKYSEGTPVYTGTKGTDTRGCYIKAVTKSGEVLTGTEAVSYTHLFVYSSTISHCFFE